MKSFNSGNRSRPLDVRNFKPESREEQVILEIAKTVGESRVAFLKSVLDRGGYEKIWAGWEEYKQEVRKGRHIRNKAAFLNHLIKKRLPGGSYDSLSRKRRW